MITDMITMAGTLDEACAADGELRAGGTDLQERRRSGIAIGPIVDITRIAGLRDIEWSPDGSARLGARVSVHDLATDELLREAFPGLTAAAADLATPQIRRVGTLGGNLAQRTRCWYYRNPDVAGCLKRGGDGCPARAGNHLYGVVFDDGPCVWPHPSSLAAALLAYDGEVEVYPSGRRPLAELYGDGRTDHVLGGGQILTHVLLGPPVTGERAAYVRAISRSYAEWPLVEVVARLVVTEARIALARVAVGGVASAPRRLPAVEAALVDAPAETETLRAVAARAADGAKPLPQTGYKVDLLRNAVLEALERCLAGGSS